MLDDGFYEDKMWAETKQHRSLLGSTSASKISPKNVQHSTIAKSGSSIMRHGLNTLLPPSSSSECCISNSNIPLMLTTTTSHQSRSLKASPSFNSSNLINLIHQDSEPPSDRNNDIRLPRNNEHLDEQKEEQVHKNISENSELLNIDDSPGGSSSDKSKKDAILGVDKKKKNKNKEGKFLHFLKLFFYYILKLLQFLIILNAFL